MEDLKEQIIEALKTIEDPDIFLDIWFLGLIYRIDILEDGLVEIDMTFTTPLCPSGPELIQAVKDKVGAINGIVEVLVTVVFYPAWQPNEEVRAMLGLE